jgi:ABC-type amino acid transport substrate-binding protein
MSSLSANFGLAAQSPSTPSLRIGVDGSFAPLSSKSGAELEGIDVDIGRALAARLKRPVDFITGTEEQLRAKLYSGELDVVIAGILATFGDRHDFITVPYLKLPAVWLRPVSTNDQTPIKTIGTRSFQLLREDFEKSKDSLRIKQVRGYEQLDSIITAMERSEVDALPMDELHAKELQQRESKRLRIQRKKGLGIPVYALIRRSDDPSAQLIQQQLDQLIQTGKTQASCSKWFKRSCPALPRTNASIAPRKHS